MMRGNLEATSIPLSFNDLINDTLYTYFPI